jgi:hypothetical protein
MVSLQWHDLNGATLIKVHEADTVVGLLSN